MKIKTKPKPRRDGGEVIGSKEQPEEDIAEKEKMEDKEVGNGEQEDHDMSGYIDVGEVYHDEDYRQEITTTELSREESKTQGENEIEPENNEKEGCKQEKWKIENLTRKQTLAEKKTRNGEECHSEKVLLRSKWTEI